MNLSYMVMIKLTDEKCFHNEIQYVHSFNMIF